MGKPPLWSHDTKDTSSILDVLSSDGLAWMFPGLEVILAKQSRTRYSSEIVNFGPLLLLYVPLLPFIPVNFRYTPQHPTARNLMIRNKYCYTGFILLFTLAWGMHACEMEPKNTCRQHTLVSACLSFFLHISLSYVYFTHFFVKYFFSVHVMLLTSK